MKRKAKRVLKQYHQPLYIRNQLQTVIEEYCDVVMDGFPYFESAEWGPWRMLSHDQCIWQLGRLSNYWVHASIPNEEITAWDEGGMVSVLKTVGTSWAELDSIGSVSTLRDFSTYGLVQMFERAKRLSGWYDSSEAHEGPPPSPQIFPKPNDQDSEYDTDVFEEELDNFIEGTLLLDFDYMELEEQTGGWLKALDPDTMRAMHIRTDYFRCPIPETISEKEIESAIQRIRGKAPR